MKKYFVLMLVVFSCLYTSADELQVVPFTAEANLTKNEWATYFEVRLENTVDVAVMQFDMYLPDGMTLISEEPMELTSDRWNGITKKGVFTPNATYSVTDKGNGHYFITLYDEDLDVQKGNTGVAFYFYYLTNNMSDGVYPIRIENVLYGPDSNSEHGCSITSSTSYVKVGSGIGSLTMTGQIPSFVNEALASETAISKLDLSAVTASNGTFTYVDGREVVAPTAEVTGDVAYVRAASKYVASINLPFAATTGTYYGLTGVDGEWAHFGAVNGVAANTTALVNAGDEVNETATGVKIAGASATTATSGYYLKNGSFYEVNGSVTVPAFRGTFDLPKGVRGFILDGTTGINTVSADEAQTIYNVAGMKLNKTQRGVNIVNGKKVVVK